MLSFNPSFQKARFVTTKTELFEKMDIQKRKSETFDDLDET